MERSELVRTLKIFAEQDQERLLLFLQSPYCTGNLDTAQELALVRYIFETFKKGENGLVDLAGAQIYAALYPNRPFKRPTINNLASSTLRMIRRFMEEEVLSRMKRPVNEHASIIKYLSEKGAVDLCEKYINRSDRIEPLEETLDDLDFYLLWRAEDARSQYLGMHNLLTDDYNLQNCLSALDKFYLAARLNSLTNLFNQNRITPILSLEERQKIIDELAYWEYSPFFKHPLIQLYYKVLLFFHLDGEEADHAFDEFMEMLHVHEKALSPFYLKRMESFAYNYCVRRFTLEKYRNILFQLFQRWIQPERLAQYELIQSHELITMVQTGLAGKQFDWVHTFLESCKNRIQGAQPSEDYYQFNRAMLLFHQGKFDQAREIVVRLNFHEMQYKYHAKTLEIKLFFETGEKDFDLFESKLNSLNVGLSRETKMTKEKKKRYTQFVNFMMRLNRWRGQPDSDIKRLEKIREDVRNAQNTAEWRWLMQKLEQLDKNQNT